MILAAFTIFHVALSLVGIGSGLVVVYGLINSKRMDGWTALFLITTLATSITGFLFPITHFTPGIGVGILSVILLTAALLGRYRFAMAGAWRRTYVITSVTALYLNVFVLIVQMFEKVPALKELAPTQSEPPFQIAQIANLVIFAALAVLAVIKFHDEPAPAAQWMARSASNRNL
jgi:hypothetical protein